MKPIEIYTHIKNQIIEQKYKLGDRLPTEHELMEEFGVGRSTIREVLTSLTGEGIIEKRHGLGSFITRVPSYYGTIAICVRFDNLISSTVWYPTLIKSINNYANKKGLDTIIAVGYGKTIKEIKNSIDAYFRKPFSKEIVAIVNTMGFDLGDMNIPVINFSNICPIGTNNIYHNYDNIFKLAKDTYTSKGIENTNILFIKDDIDIIGEELYIHLESLVNEYFPNKECQVEIESYDTVTTVFDKWYKNPKRSKSIFIQDDGVLDRIIPYLYLNNIKIPEDLSIVTFANTHKKIPFPVEFFRIGFDHKVTANLLVENLDLILKGKDIGIIKVDPIFMAGKSIYF